MSHAVITLAGHTVAITGPSAAELAESLQAAAQSLEAADFAGAGMVLGAGIKNAIAGLHPALES